MKIKKFENVNTSDDFFSPQNDSGKNLVVKIDFSGKSKVSFSDIKESDYYVQYYKPNMTDEEIDSLIYYSLEQVIYNKGLGGYSSTLVDENDEEVDIGVYRNSKKYNL